MAIAWRWRNGAAAMRAPRHVARHRRIQRMKYRKRKYLNDGENNGWRCKAYESGGEMAAKIMKKYLKMAAMAIWRNGGNNEMAESVMMA